MNLAHAKSRRLARHKVLRGRARYGTPEMAGHDIKKGKRKPRPAGWNQEVADKRAAERVAKAAARKANRGLRTGRPSSLQGFPASINRHTGKPHEHKRAIARRTAA